MFVRAYAGFFSSDRGSETRSTDSKCARCSIRQHKAVISKDKEHQYVTRLQRPLLNEPAAFRVIQQQLATDTQEI